MWLYMSARAKSCFFVAASLAEPQIRGAAERGKRLVPPLDGQASSEGSSFFNTKLRIFEILTRQRSVFRVFLYHYAVASPGARAEAAAITPTFNRPEVCAFWRIQYG
jgi:hypothetical protein